MDASTCKQLLYFSNFVYVSVHVFRPVSVSVCESIFYRSWCMEVRRGTQKEILLRQNKNGAKTVMEKRICFMIACPSSVHNLSQRWSCSDNCNYTEIDAVDQTCCLTQSQCETGPAMSNIDLKTPACHV